MRTQGALLLVALCASLAGCSMESSTNIGKSTRFMQRNGWGIHLNNVGTAQVVDTDWGTTVNTGGHKIEIGDGVKLDGKPVATGSSGDVRITNDNGKVALVVNGQ